jgi:hypothetical protein
MWTEFEIGRMIEGPYCLWQGWGPPTNWLIPRGENTRFRIPLIPESSDLRTPGGCQRCQTGFGRFCWAVLGGLCAIDWAQKVDFRQKFRQGTIGKL